MGLLKIGYDAAVNVSSEKSDVTSSFSVDEVHSVARLSSLGLDRSILQNLLSLKVKECV